MRITTHGQYLTQLTSLGVMNMYLVRESDGFSLIDTGMGGNGKALVAAAQQLGGNIVRILLTHDHADHVGSLDELAAALPDIPVIISAHDARFLSGDKHFNAGEPTTKLRGGYVITKTKPRTLLHDGDMVGSLRAISTPGHTPGHMAFLDTRDNSLIVGDAFQTQGGVAVAGIWRWLFPLPAMATWHLPTAVASAKQLAQLSGSRLAPGHGRCLNSQPRPCRRRLPRQSRR